MTATDSQGVLHEAAGTLESLAREQTDGVWLEHLTADVAPLIRDWNLDGCWRWRASPDTGLNVTM
ncbi:MAG: hypothetical protein OXF61_11310 [Acidimicrobiaceae bacterium]|nr:hypothetical protein [Acidimicrobiaceae bacterium]